MGASDAGVLAGLLRDPALREQFTQLTADQQAAWAWRALWLSVAHDHQKPRRGIGGRCG